MANQWWRMAKTPITLLVLVAMVALAWFWGSKAMTAPIGPRIVKPCVNQPINGGKLDSTQVTVHVFNGSRLRGKAADVSQQLKNAGFKVTKVGNAPAQSPKTKITGFAADAPEVKLVAGWFQNAELVGDGRIDHSVEVTIGADYNGMQKQAPMDFPVTTPTICLPVPPTVTE